MATAYTNGLNQVATYWAPGVNDGFGGIVYSVAPVVIACRWQDKLDRIRSSSGEVITSTAIVYADRALSVKGYICLGDVTDQVDSDGLLDPEDVTGATPQEIKNVGTSPTIDADVILHKVWL